MNEAQALAHRTRIKHAYPEAHVDIQQQKPAGSVETVNTLWVWRAEDEEAVPLRTEAEVEQWLEGLDG